MPWWHIAILALIQGAAELWPISSSAHVIVAERLLGLDPGAPEMTWLLVMLHTGTMGAVVVYFWPQWRPLLATAARGAFLRQVCLATACTGGLGLALTLVLEQLVLARLLGHAHAEVEQLFRHLPVISAALLAVGLLILRASWQDRSPLGHALTGKQAVLIGVVQSLCLPFRGFSRSGATISTALLCGLSRRDAESFSFALAVGLTPPVLGRELWRGQPVARVPRDGLQSGGGTGGPRRLISRVGARAVGVFRVLLCAGRRRRGAGARPGLHIGPGEGGGSTGGGRLAAADRRRQDAKRASCRCRWVKNVDIR
jgi:undecaprenyl-diphosphatase